MRGHGDIPTAACIPLTDRAIPALLAAPAAVIGPHEGRLLRASRTRVGRLLRAVRTRVGHRTCSARGSLTGALASHSRAAQSLTTTRNRCMTESAMTPAPSSSTALPRSRRRGRPDRTSSTKWADTVGVGGHGPRPGGAENGRTVTLLHRRGPRQVSCYPPPPPACALIHRQDHQASARLHDPLRHPERQEIRLVCHPPDAGGQPAPRAIRELRRQDLCRLGNKGMTTAPTKLIDPYATTRPGSSP